VYCWFGCANRALTLFIATNSPCRCNSTAVPPRRHEFGDSYMAKVAYVDELEPFYASPKRKHVVVSSIWDPLETSFVPGPDGTESMVGYKGWLSTPMKNTIVSHKYFYQSRDHWVHVKCAGIQPSVALVSFAAGDDVANNLLDETLKLKRDGRMKHLHPNGARLLMDHERRCLSWQTTPANEEAGKSLDL
jgi:hypothetical protein